MNTTNTFPSHAAEPVRSAARPRRLVVDAPTRAFHWLFALSFLGAHLTAESEHWRALHVTLGYTVAGLVTFRLLYGLFGPRHARLGLLMRKLAGAPAWLASVAASLRPGAASGVPWRQGQNLLMAVAVLLLLVLALPLTLSGYGSYNDWGDWIQETHEFFGNAFLAVVLGHIALIATLSALRRKNQALPMLTGRMPGAGPDLVKSNPRWLAVLLVVAVVGFFAWRWVDSPQGLIPTASAVQGAAGRHGDDDD